MFNQLKTVFTVALIEVLAGFLYYVVMYVGGGEFHALNSIFALGATVVIGWGLVTARRIDDKAHSKTGAPRISLDSNTLIWYGFGLLMSANLAGTFPSLWKEGGFVEILIQAALVLGAAVLASRALNAEVVYTTRKYPPGILYVPFFFIAMVVPSNLGLPTFVLVPFGILQVIIVLVLIITPWSPVARQRSA